MLSSGTLAAEFPAGISARSALNQIAEGESLAGEAERPVALIAAFHAQASERHGRRCFKERAQHSRDNYGNAQMRVDS